jgi:saccharopine dehydrogenase-like NADP-dependent oxidoreductase
MSGFKNFTIAGSGAVGSHIVRELLKLKTEGRVDNVTILTRTVSSLARPSHYLRSSIHPTGLW